MLLKLRGLIIVILIALLFFPNVYGSGFEEFNSEGLIVSLIVFGLLNSLRPIMFIMIIFLLSMIALIDEQKILKIGLSFTGGVFIGYILIGLGLIQLHRRFDFLSYLVVAFSLFVGIYKILKAFGTLEFRLSNPFREKSNKILEKATSPLSAFAVGAVMSVLSLICTLPPYLLITSILSQSFSFGVKISLLAFYNLIFIASLLLITVSFHYGKKIPKIENALNSFSKISGRET